MNNKTSKPQYVLYAGINGAGKSTLHKLATNIDIIDIDNLSSMKRINPDEILRSFGGNSNNRQDQFKSAKRTVELIEHSIKNKISFNQETTLAGRARTHEKRLGKLKDQGYELHLFYVALPSDQLAKSRVEDRVKKGGHHIPSKTIEKRYVESFENLKQVIKYFETVNVFDNSDIAYDEVVRFANGKIILDRTDKEEFQYLSFIPRILNNELIMKRNKEPVDTSRRVNKKLDKLLEQRSIKKSAKNRNKNIDKTKNNLDKER